MDAVEFLKALGRLCNCHSCGDDCPLIDSCDDDSNDGYARKVRTVEQWAKEHPVKTRQSELFKLFPNTPCYSDGCIDMCPCEVGCLLMDDDNSICVHDGDGVDCGKCKRDFWLKEID